MSGLRAVVLAAGLGTRLRPLTEFEPKPLLPVGGRPLVAHTLDQLEAAGCEAVALNLHHLGDRIRERVGDTHGAMSIVYSEESRLLGTLGALAPLRDFWSGAEALVVVNGDTLCRWPIRQLIKRHRRQGAETTLMVSRRARVQEYGGGVGLDKTGRLVSLRPGTDHGEVHRRRVFAGAHVLSPALLHGLPEEPLDFVPNLWAPMLESGRRIAAYESFSRWFESGTPELYLRSVRGWVGRRWLPRWLRGSWIAPGASAHGDARISRSVVENAATVEAGAVVERSLILPGARVPAGCTVRGSIIGFGVALAADTSVERRVVTLERAEVPPREGDSLVGGLVYSPLRPPSRELRGGEQGRGGRRNRDR